jgi:hypothetical protein
MRDAEIVRTALNGLPCRCMRADGETWMCSRCEGLAALDRIEAEANRQRAVIAAARGVRRWHDVEHGGTVVGRVDVLALQEALLLMDGTPGSAHAG